MRDMHTRHQAAHKAMMEKHMAEMATMAEGGDGENPAGAGQDAGAVATAPAAGAAPAAAAA
jgi:hypothetical protein